MAYSTDNPPGCIAENVNGAGGLWLYKDGDAIAAVDATDYFTNASDLGMQTGDVIVIIDTTNNLSSFGQITVDADGNGTATALTAFP